MYALHRLTNSSQRYLDTFIGNNRAKSDGFCFALASVLVNALQVKEDSNQDGTLTRECVVKLSDILHKLGEMIRFDTDKTMGYVCKLVAFKAKQSLWTSGTRIIHSEATAVQDFFGISEQFSQEDLMVIINCGTKIGHDVLCLQTLFLDLRLLNNGQ